MAGMARILSPPAVLSCCDARHSVISLCRGTVGEFIESRQLSRRPDDLIGVVLLCGFNTGERLSAASAHGAVMWSQSGWILPQ